MRHLVDLNSKIAVITWWEKNVFPYDKEGRYKDLYRKKYQWKDPMTEDEEKEFEELKAFEGEVGINVESVQITNMCPVEADQIQTTFSLTGYELKQINDAIEKLREPYNGQKVSIYEAVELGEW